MPKTEIMKKNSKKAPSLALLSGIIGIGVTAKDCQKTCSRVYEPARKRCSLLKSGLRNLTGCFPVQLRVFERTVYCSCLYI